MSTPNIPQLHAEFNRLTGAELRLNYLRESTWMEFTRQKFTAEDLALVVRWLRVQIGSNNSGGFSQLSLQFSTFSADGWSRFEERLAMAKKQFRTRPVPVSATQTTTLPNGDQIRRQSTRDASAQDAPVAVAILSRAEMDRIKAAAFSRSQPSTFNAQLPQ